MGEHKHNPVEQMAATRPKCGSCVHFVLGDNLGNGFCTEGPPTAFKLLIPVQVPTGTLMQPGVPQTQLRESVTGNFPPINKTKWCGHHPDFVEWFSAWRRELRQQGELTVADVGGEA